MHTMHLLSSVAIQPNNRVENLAQTTSKFFPISYRAPRRTLFTSQKKRDRKSRKCGHALSIPHSFIHSFSQHAWLLYKCLWRTCEIYCLVQHWHPWIGDYKIFSFLIWINQSFLFRKSLLVVELFKPCTLGHKEHREVYRWMSHTYYRITNKTKDKR
jgi:hypothetical protein